MKLTTEKFVKDVARHELSIVRDDGVNRHLRFARPATNCMSFDIITWPGHLCYSGDMGTYVFSRIEDTFEFFRSRDGELHINTGYWAEKVLAQDRADGITQFDPDKFTERVRDWLKDAEASPEVVADVECEVLTQIHDGEHQAMRAAMDYSHDESGFRFTDFWEVNCREYTHRFVWCCYAMVWGIQQYDASREAARPADGAETGEQDR